MRHILGIICFSALSFLSLWGCTEVAEYKDPMCHLTVTVRDQKNASLSGCSIMVTSTGETTSTKTLVSGTDGEQYFDLTPGDYTVVANKDEYFPSEPKTVHLSESDSNIKITIVLNQRPAYITTEPEVLDFGSQESLTKRFFKILNKSWEDLDWAVADTQCPWIVSISPSNDILKREQTANIEIVIDRDELKAGENQTIVTVVSLNGKGSSEVLVKAIGRDRPSFLTVDPEILDFGEQYSVTHRSFKLNNDTGKDQEWHLADFECPWISSVTPLSGTLKKNLTETVEVVIDREKLQGGENQTILTISSTTGQGNLEIRIQAIGENKWPPIVNVKEATSVDKTTATIHGEIIDAGSPAYVQRGFAYFTQQDESDATTIYAEKDDSQIFSANLSSLTPGTTYYVKAFAANQDGSPTWSKNRVSFKTIGEYPKVQTDGVTNIDVVANTCVFNGTILSAGDPVYSEKGFCYGTTEEPTISGSHVPVSGITTGSFSHSCNLNQHTTYYVRAYVIQEGRPPIYGNSVSFNTNLTSTKVLSYAATNVTGTTATLNGSITEVGTPAYSEKGFCYTEGSATPSISSSSRIVCSGTGKGDFSKTINVNYDTYYSFRAYAIQNGSPVYGETLHFTSGYTKASVTTLDVSAQDYEHITLNAEINIMGDPAITECGFCYVDYADNHYYYPVVSDKKIKASIGKEFSAVIDNSELIGKTDYCYRSYVIQNGNVIYGGAKFFTSYVKPQVIVGPVKDLVPAGDGTWSATFQGAFADGCWPAVTGLAFVYGTAPDPTIDNKTAGIITTDVIFNDGANAYVFTAHAKNIPANQTFYLRALVTTNLGVFYSNNTNDGVFSTH